MTHAAPDVIVDLARKVAAASTLDESAAHLCGIGDAIKARRMSFVADYASGGALHAKVSTELNKYFEWDRQVTRSWFNRSLHLSSPIGARCRTDEQPFVWNVCDVQRQPSSRGDASKGDAPRGQWHFSLERGIVAGITAPVHRPLGRVASVTWMTACDSQDLDRVVADYGPLLSMAAQAFIQMVIRADSEHNASAPGLRTQFKEAGDLTALEVECLQWIALGKTDDEIAQLIGRSRAAVRFRLKTAMAKLGTSSRAQAVAVCSQLGLLHPLVKA